MALLPIACWINKGCEKGESRT